MNTHPPKTGGRFKGVDYFDGGLFALPARLELQMSELELLREATTFDWSKVQPEIFGTLFQHSLERDDRRTFGARSVSRTSTATSLPAMHSSRLTLGGQC